MFNSKSAFASLPIMLLIGGMFVEMVIAGVFVAYFLGQSSFGVKYSQDALTAAQAGVDDALIRIVRNKDFNSNYTFAVGSSSVQVSVCKDTCAGVNKSQIDSIGTAFNKKREIRAIININNLTGEVKLESEKEIPAQ